MDDNRRYDMGHDKAGLGLPFPPNPFETGIQGGIGANPFGQMQQSLAQQYLRVSEFNFTSDARFHQGCQRFIDEIKRYNKDNCILKEL